MSGDLGLVPGKDSVWEKGDHSTRIWWYGVGPPMLPFPPGVLISVLWMSVLIATEFQFPPGRWQPYSGLNPALYPTHHAGCMKLSPHHYNSCGQMPDLSVSSAITGRALPLQCLSRLIPWHPQDGEMQLSEQSAQEEGFFILVEKDGTLTNRDKSRSIFRRKFLKRWEWRSKHSSVFARGCRICKWKEYMLTSLFCEYKASDCTMSIQSCKIL